MESIKFKDNKVIAEIPEELYMALIRIQGDDNLKFEETCKKAAVLIDTKKDEFNIAVKKEVNKLSKSRFMIQLNTAKQTIKDTAFIEGLKKGEQFYRYPCSICGEEIPLSDNTWESAREYLESKGWGHAKCHEQNS